jgi:ABC-type Mn2+/Zn2+ transport system ATPase subunit
VQIARGDRTVLTIDDLELGPGYTAIVGPNGSGKSTLLDAIAGVLPTERGRIDVRTGRSGGPSRAIAYVLQAQHASEHLLVSAAEVVALARAAARGPFRPLRAADRAAVRAAMERLEVADLARRRLAAMSGGQRQRVFVAQGLAQDAPILLLDEPVAGLDLPSTALIRAAVEEERWAGRVVVVATHDLAEARRADRVVLLNGEVVAAGRPAATLTVDNLRAAYGGRVLALGGEVLAVDDGIHHDDHEHDHTRYLYDEQPGPRDHR